MRGAVTRARAEGRQVREVCGELMGAADHALRTPLTSIVGYTEMLLDGEAGALNLEQERMVESINGNCARMVRLVQEMLDDVLDGLPPAHGADHDLGVLL